MKTTVLDKEYYDRIDHYILGKDGVEGAVLELDYENHPRKSSPISVEKLKQNWEVCNNK